MKHPHLGQNIENRLHKIGMTKAEFGRRLGVSRQSVGQLLKKEALHTDTLLKVSEVLDYDFVRLLLPPSQDQPTLPGPSPMYLTIPLPSDPNKRAHLLHILDHTI